MENDLISRHAAIELIERMKPYHQEADDIAEMIANMPSAQPEVIRCKDCRKHNISVGYKEDCCALFEWRGVSYGHEHDYQYCCHAERRTDE